MLTDLGFIVGVACGVVGVPMYILIIVIVIKSKSCSGSFFRLFIVTGVVNIIMEIDRIWMFYLPQYTCADKCALSTWVKQHNWWVDGVLFIVNRHGLLIQFLMSTIVSCDRFIVICMQSRFKELWNSYHMIVVAICFVIPLVTTYPFFLGTCNVYFEYYPESDNYKQNYKCSIEPYYNKYVIGFRLVTTVSSTIFNFGVFLFFFLGKLKVSGTQRKTEMKLFIYSLTELVLQASATILSFFLDAWNDSHPSMYHVILKIVYYLTDAATILPPFVLLLTSKSVRQAVFPCLKTKVPATNVSVLSVK